MDRIRGQTSDLQVELVAAHAQAPRGNAEEQLRTAERLAQQHDAGLVLWTGFGPRVASSDVNGSQTRTLRLFVARPGTGSVIARAIACESAADSAEGAAPPPSLPSACVEAVAVAARTALVALDQGGFGNLASPAPIATTRTFAAGWFGAADGQTRHGLHGGLVRVELAHGRIGAAFSLVAGFPASLSDDLTTVEMSRHLATAGAFFELGEEDGLALSLGARVGLALFHRVTIAVAAPQGDAEGIPALLPTSPRYTPALVMGPELVLRARPPILRGVGVALGLSLDVHLGAPELGYEGIPAGRASRPLRVAEPAAFFAFFVRTR
jgi:hypothetical protein